MSNDQPRRCFKFTATGRNVLLDLPSTFLLFLMEVNFSWFVSIVLLKEFSWDGSSASNRHTS